MHRFHLFEFNDRPWVPEVLREGLTGYLEAVSRAFGFHLRLAPIVARILRESGTDRIVDLCSGGGGPILEVQNELDPRPQVVLTDLLPNRTVFESMARDRVTAVLDPVDATAVPAHFTGLRTVVNAFHHFRPDAARKILADAVSCGAPVAVIEIPERTLLNVLLSPLFVPLTLAFMPMVRPMRWQYLVFCYLIPILPLMVFWDGLVSHLRAYSRDELETLIEGLGGDYAWRIDRVPVGSGVCVTTLVGTPAPTVSRQ